MVWDILADGIVNKVEVKDHWISSVKFVKASVESIVKPVEKFSVFLLAFCEYCYNWLRRDLI